MAASGQEKRPRKAWNVSAREYTPSSTVAAPLPSAAERTHTHEHAVAPGARDADRRPAPLISSFSSHSESSSVASPTSSPAMLEAERRAQDLWARTHVHPLRPDGRPIVYILRGISGSGKSTLMAALIAGLPREVVRVCTADAFFLLRGGASEDPHTHEVTGGTYAFDASFLPSAHAYCNHAFQRALSDRIPVIVVDNTNTTLAEYDVYRTLTRAHNERIRTGEAPPPLSLPLGLSPLDTHTPPLYRLRVIEIACPDQATLSVFASRGRHGADFTVCVRQWARFQHDETAAVVPAYLKPEEQRWVDEQRTAYALQTAAALLYSVPQPAATFGVPPAFPVAPSAYSAAPQSAPALAPVLEPAAATPALSVQTQAAPHADAASLMSAYYDPRLQHGTLRVLRSLEMFTRNLMFVGIFIYADSRTAVYRQFPAKHSVVHVDHVTVIHKPRAGQVSLELLACVGLPVRLRVLGEVSDASSQAILVSWADMDAPDYATMAASAGADASTAAHADSAASPPAMTPSVRGATDQELDDAANTPDAASAPSLPASAVTPSPSGKSPSKASYAAAVRGSSSPAKTPDTSGTPPLSMTAATASDTLGNIPRVRAAIAAVINRRSMLSQNAYPHITVSSAEGVSPAASNDLIRRVIANRTPLTPPMSSEPLFVSGRLGVVVTTHQDRPPKYLTKLESVLRTMRVSAAQFAAALDDIRGTAV